MCHFASASVRTSTRKLTPKYCPWTPLGDFCPRPHLTPFKNSWIRPMDSTRGTATDPCGGGGGDPASFFRREPLMPSAV